MSNSSIVENCTRLEDELCNGGPTVWSRFNKTKVGSFKIVGLLDHSSKLDNYFCCSLKIKDCYRSKCIVFLLEFTVIQIAYNSIRKLPKSSYHVI